MAFMLVRAEDFCIDGYVVSNHGAGTHPLVPTEILRRITC
jgi:hypothetical protein